MNDDLIKQAEEILNDAEISRKSFATYGWYLISDTENFHKAAEVIRQLIAKVKEFERESWREEHLRHTRFTSWSQNCPICNPYEARSRDAASKD